MSARAAFTYPSFRFYLFSRFLAVSSSEMQAVAVAWQIYSLTHRPLDLGLVGLAQFLPGLLLFPLSGHAADRFPRRHILRTCYVCFALCSLALLALTLHGLHSVWPVYVVIVANGTSRAFNNPASQSFLPLLVPEEHFPAAVAWGSSVFTTATICGPVFGGLLYGAAGGAAPVYAIAVAAYLTAFLLVTRIRLQTPEKSRGAASFSTILEGLRFIRRNRLVLGAISLDLFAVLLGGAVALLPVYAREILRIGALGLGILRAAPGVGATAMAIVLAHHPFRRHAGAAMLTAVAGFGAFTIVFGVSRSPLISLAALVLIGAFDMVSVIVRQTMVQLGTPDEMRGRVSAVNMVFIGASNEVGQFESGITAQWFGAVPAVVAGGIGTLIVVGAWTLLFPVLRKWRGTYSQPSR